MKDFEPVIIAPALKKKLSKNNIKWVFAFQEWEKIISSEVDEETEEQYPYCIVIKSMKVQGVKYILSEDDDFIYIQYGWK